MRIFLSLILILGSSAFADENGISLSQLKPVNQESTSAYNVEVNEKGSRLGIGFYGQITQFSGVNGSLQGYTLEAMVDYAIRERWAAQLSLAQAVSSQGGVSVLFTGLRAGAAYSVMGSFVHNDSVLTVNNKEVANLPANDKSALIADVGIDQILFNGTSRIVPATGGSLGLRYDLNFWRVRASAMARYGQLMISDTQATMITVGVGILLHF